MAIVKIQTGLRLDETMYGKLSSLAAHDHRSLNNMIEHILRKYIDNYEQENGTIAIHEDNQ
ncbi:MAG: hypothetical protein J6K13_01595 [Clostridia bacterium]|nr:hypothetical protein [Clostridia bacterium]